MIQIKKIREKFGVELSFIILLLRIYFKKAASEELSIFLNKNVLNWALLSELIYAYEIRPLIYKVLSKYPSGVNKEFLTQLKDDCLFIVGSNFEKLKEVLRLHQVFQIHNLKVVPFKGVFLSQLLFGDYTTRETCDIDFLFYCKDSIALTRILFSEGYQTDFYFNEDREEFILKISSERLFYKKDTKSTERIEIHWLILPPSFDVPFSPEMMLKTTDKVQIFGSELELLNMENSLLTLLGHHGVTDAWRNLKHVVDTAAFLDKHSEKIKWNTFEILLKQNRLEKTSKIGFILAHQIIGIPLPPIHFKKKWQPKTKKVLFNLLSYPMFNKFKYSIKHFSQHLSLRDSVIDQVRFLFKCFSLLFIPTANDLKWISLSKNWFFIYYFLKPLRLTRDYLQPGVREHNKNK